MYYHASNMTGRKELNPFSSSHKKPLVYFSSKRENVLVYVSNPVEKYCREIGFVHPDRYYRFMSYRFTDNDILEIQEYWPNAVEDTYKGSSGYIYSVSNIPKKYTMKDIPYVVASPISVEVEEYEYVPDAFNAIEQAAKEGKIRIRRYHELSNDRKETIKRMIKNEYLKAQEIPEYKVFLEAKFSEIVFSGSK